MPSILQSDNGKEFRNQVITSLKVLWPELKICHGRPRHPQSQGSVERANADIKKMLAIWMRENKSKKWSMGLNFIQLRKNNSFHTGIKSSPYKAVFGSDTPLGVTSAALPSEDFKTVKELYNLLGIEFDKNEFYEDDEIEPV